jgi:hypothetical protein
MPVLDRDGVGICAAKILGATKVTIPDAGHASNLH